MAYPESIEALVEAFRRFPGIGRVTAERLTFHVLRDPEARGLARAIERVVTEAKRCSICCNVAEQDPCRICANEARDSAIVAVVEEPRHVEALERAGVFNGRYHVLMGALHPGEGTEPAHLTVDALLERVRSGEVSEVILATDPDAEGEATAMHVLQALESTGSPDVVITRLARGLPAGSAIEYMHRGVLEDALEGRRPLRTRHR